MERIEGPDLHDFIEAQPDQKLAEPMARRLFRHVLAALVHAHGAGYLHCDVKPENVRLQLEGRDGATTAVLVDWGLARRIDKQPEFLQEGTRLYASPEQLTGCAARRASEQRECRTQELASKGGLRMACVAPHTASA